MILNHVLGILVPVAVSIASAYVMLSWWIKVAPILGFLGKDMNKPGHPLVVEAGGLWVVLAFVFGIMSYVALDTYIDASHDTVPLLAVCLTVLLAGLLGFIDDLLGWKKGVTPVKRVLLTVPIALPLVVVKAGYTVVEIPFIGPLDLGVFYPLVVVPIGVLGASNAFNMIAGYNGLEALQGVVLMVFATVLMLLRGNTDFLYLAMPVVSSIALFYLLYNRYPARMFPGNSFTYGVGSLYASLAIYWSFEKYAVLSFALYFVELLLFIRGLLNGVYKENFGLVLDDGSLLPPYSKSYSITHVAIKVVRTIKKKCYERDVVRFVVALQVLVCLLGILVTVSLL